MQDIMKQEVRYLKEPEVKEITGISLQKLRNDRSAKVGIPYIKKGRFVRYLLSDVVEFMESGRINTER